ncbi:uncharacterized protein LOC117147841 isoform X3 [Drosophila mauritiana]|uniref:Uncharacterized protein LOC117147841 isoform X3 n=1 Tax=Drosophila mauritiana TaxID=7226 RepID=A0A6P8KP13_DROMA|nr:uncharacterized protein LOC117147841 isoform X3 [Drosophila mauritiana]
MQPGFTERVRDHLMLIEIYDYAAKLLNNMTARGVRNSVGKAGKAEAAEAAEAAESRTKESTGKLGSLLGRTLAKVARSNPAQHVTNLPVSALLLQALDVADVARGQGIDYPITSTTSISTTFNTTNTTTTGSDPTDVLGGQPPAFSFPANVTGASGSAGDADAYLPTGNLSGFIESSTTAVMSTLPIPLPIPTSTMATLQAQTVATFIAATGSKNRPTTIVVYPTVSPESIVIPIVSCIFGFPILALLVICCLRRRAKLARERDRRRNYDMQDHAVSLPLADRMTYYRSSRAISLRPERSLSQGFTSLELDTVLEERCSDVEQTQTEMFNAESPMDTTSYKMSFSSS